jgi:hypothetical protein
MVLKKATAKIKELVGKALDSYGNSTWNEIIARWLTTAGVASLLANLCYAYTVHIATDLSILFEVEVVGSILVLILAQLIFLNENLKKNKKKEC